MKNFKFEDVQLINVDDIYAVTHKNKIVTLDGRTTFSKISHAKSRLQKVLTDNYRQGHYWHKGKENTFSEEGGYMRNGGAMVGLDKTFKKLGRELTNELLDSSVFVIKRLQ